MGLVPCPNKGACGSRSHNQKSARYRECLASARFSGRGTSVRGMVVPKAPKDDILNRRLGDVHWYKSVIVPEQEDTPEIKVWRHPNGSDFCARFKMPIDWGSYLFKIGMVESPYDEGGVVNFFEEHAEDAFRMAGEFFGMENCDMPYGLSNDYLVGDIVLDDNNYDDTIEDVVDMVREKIQFASDKDAPRRFEKFMLEEMKRRQE